MKKTALIFLLIASAMPAMASNFAECILDKLPGSANGATNTAVHSTCRAEYPSAYFSIKRGHGRGIFGFKDGNACTIKKAKDTPFQWSAGAIAIACHCLYRKPEFKGEMCEYQQVN